MNEWAIAVKAGGRKWRAFILLTLIFTGFVLFGYIKSETVIRDLMLGLLAVYGAGNVGEHFASKGKPTSDEAAPK